MCINWGVYAYRLGGVWLAVAKLNTYFSLDRISNRASSSFGGASPTSPIDLLMKSHTPGSVNAICDHIFSYHGVQVSLTQAEEEEATRSA